MSDRVAPVRVALVGGDFSARWPVTRRWRGAVLTAYCTASASVIPVKSPASIDVAASLDELFERCGARFDVVLAADDLSEPFLTPLLTAAVPVGKHVLLESPGALSAPEFGEWKRRCQAQGLHLLAASPLRARPAVVEVVAAVRSGKLGSVGVMRLHDWCDHATTAAQTLQRRREHADLACWLFDAQPELVFASAGSVDTMRRQPVSTVIHLGFPHQGAALIDLVENLPEGDGYFSLSVIGSTGAAYADDHHNRQLVFSGGSAQAHQTGEGDWPLLMLQQKLIDALVNGTDVITLAEVERADRVLQSLEKSLTTGESQPIA